MKCPVCRATYRKSEPPAKPKLCHRCGADLSPLVALLDQAIAYHRRAIAQFTAGDWAAAMVDNDQAIALYSQNPSFHAFAGQLWALQGKFGQADRSWQLAEAIDPKNKRSVDCLEILDQLMD
jgi:tetratricopeptide (TPR) repeat protein